jgi:hypothetical protein
MTIRIARNESGNCINFIGSSQPAYWNACLSAQINVDDNSRVDIINDIRSQNDPETQFEFYAVSFADFSDKDGNDFISAQEMVDYVNEHANVLGTSDTGVDLTGQFVNFRLDATHTSIIMNNGAAFGVNTIQAVANADGTIHIHAVGAESPNTDSSDANEHRYFQKLENQNVAVNGNAVPGGLQDVVNVLNELFTVGPFESVVISDPYSTLVADIGGLTTTGTLVGDAINPSTGDIAGGSSAHYNKAGWLSTDTIDQAGEYFTFDIRVEGIIGMGLVVADVEDVIGNVDYGNPANFCVNGNNSGHWGYQFGHFFHPSPNGPWTNYGASTAYVQGLGWSNATYKFANSSEGADWLAGNNVKMRVGLNDNGFISIDYYDSSESTWITCARTSYPTVSGVEYKLGIKFCDSNVRLVAAPKVHLLEPAAPAMYFRYIESPDGVFHWPLFATEEEADYYDQNHAGSTVGTGTSHIHTYADDPTNTTWYMPDTGSIENDVGAPSGNNPNAYTFEDNSITYTEISSLTDADLTPSAFSNNSISQEEGSVVNIQLYPAGATFSQTATIAPAGSGLVYNAATGYLQGTLAEVATDTVYTVTISRANAYGSSTGTLTITSVDITPAVPISGFTVIAGSTALVDSDTLDDGSAVTLDDVVQDGYRFKMTDAYVTSNILPALQNSGDMVYVGFAPDTVNGWATITGDDFVCGFRFQYVAANTVSVTPLLDSATEGTTRSHGYSSNLGYDFYLSNKGGVLEANYNLSSTDKTSSLTVADGGSFTFTAEQDTSVTGSKTIAIAATGTTADISTTGLSEHQLPSVPSLLTSWDKALNFSGSNQHLKQVSSNMYHQPLQMNGLATTVDLGTSSQGSTSDASTSRPWATCVVFKSDGHNSNQIIWNQGEGSSSGSDNIYLRLSASGSLFFGWGREGSGYNECRLANQTISSSNWYGVFVGHSGVRLGGNSASASNLADCFDIRMMNSTDSFGSISSNLSATANWTSTGNRMDRTVAGDFTIGGRSSGKNFHGKIASMIVTTLLTGNYTVAQQPGGIMYIPAQIEAMITDPVTWLADYKVRHGLYNTSAPFRPPASRFAVQPFLLGNTTGAYQATHVWLMGDGASDSYSNGIRNYIYPADQNSVKLQLNSMVSNDFEIVNIPGLT